jgi:hypothetical protein
LAYGLEFRTLLKAMGISLDKAGREPMPDQFISKVPDIGSAEKQRKSDRPERGRGGFLEQLLRQLEEIPFFLLNSIGVLSGLGCTELQNYFWIGGQQDPLYPYLTNGLLVLANHRRKTPFHFASKPVWQQPVYIILKRDGSYLCACCGVENGTLVIHPYAPQFHRSERLRYRQDAEIIGQIVAVVRKLV